MKIAYKLAFVLALPVILTWLVVLYATSTSEKSLSKAIEEASVSQAHAVMEEVDRVIHSRIADWMAYGESPEVQELLRLSNLRFAQMEGAQHYIDEMDAAWRREPAGSLNPLMRRTLDNELAKGMRTRLRILEEAFGYPVFGEVFITNRYGVNVAQTSRTSDYRQDDEDWWQRAKRDGLYVAEVGYDESADMFSTAICLRIYDKDGAFAGVLKAVLNIKEAVDIVEAQFSEERRGADYNYLLFNSERQIIHSADPTKKFLADGSSYFVDIVPPSHGAVFSAYRDNVEKDGIHWHLLTYAFSSGFSGFAGLGWSLVIEHDADFVLAPVHALRKHILWMAFAATVAALTFGSAVAVSLSRRLRSLCEATIALGHGDLDRTVKLSGGDELTQFAAHFNDMAAKLKHATSRLREQASSLEQKNVQLERHIAERKQAEIERASLQSQLAQAQKLEAIGRLAAGIAHEINTPIQFIGDNIKFFREAFSSFVDLLAKYAALLKEGRSGVLKEEIVADVDAAVAEADVDYLMREVPKAIEQSLDGVERVTTIVRSMKEFSHPGGKHKEFTDLNKAIQNTITVARNEWKYVAEMVTDLNPSLPDVPVLTGDFNQVILNMIVNAAHAIKEVVGDNPETKGTITISTRQEDDWAEIRLSDTGIGMSKEVLEKIFDPFFTTKGVGKGTGQGLAIAHTVIVKMHGGSIEAKSEPDRGTTFVVRLPLESDTK